MGRVEVFGVHLPEIGHGREGIVAAHRPHRVGVGTRNQDVLLVFQGQYAIVLQQHYRLCGNVVGGLPLLGRVEFDVFLAVEIGVVVEQSGAEFLAEHVFHCPFQRLGLHQTLVDGFLQVLVVHATGEVDVVAAVDGCRGFLRHIVDAGQLVDGGVVAHHHAVEAEVATQNVVEYLAVGHAVGAVNGMVAGHQRLAACQAYHRLMGQQDFLHQFLLFGVTAAAIAQVVL